MNNLNELKTKYINMIVTLLTVIAMAAFLHGPKVIELILVAVFTAVVVDFIIIKFKKQAFWKQYDFSFIITAIIVTLALPATAPLWMPVVGVLVALLVAKHPFGGVGRNIFNPAATGIAFLAISWSDIFFKYPLPLTNFGIDNQQKAQLFSESSSSILNVGGTPSTNYFDIFFGRYAGPLGVTCMVLLACCLFYLWVRKTVKLSMVLPAILVVTLFAIVMPRVVTGRIASVIHELSSGMFIFGIIFMASDPTTTPKLPLGRVLFSTMLGLMVVLFRRFGSTEISFVYALLIMNALSTSLDKLAVQIMNFYRSHKTLRVQENVEDGVINE